MDLLFISILLLLVSAVVSLFLYRFWSLSNRIGSIGATSGCLLGLIPAFRILFSGNAESLRMSWNVPYGSFFVGLDALSAFFLIPILGLSALVSIYGAQYLTGYRDKKYAAPSWFFFNILIASMVMVVIAKNGLLFLLVWEAMSLSSFFLVIWEHEKEAVREAGWTYLVATHLGSSFLIVMFLLLGREAGSLDFDKFDTVCKNSGIASVLFLLAIIGFGTKAGFMPFHVWLPEAHPAAPSHVSALMSGVMIKTGIYGLVRTLEFLGTPPLWWGWVFIAIGLSSGILGVLFALAQHDLKCLLAYHSVENIGIISLGLGVGLIGVSSGNPAIAVLGFGGGLLHVVNHALFKGLLFLGAGCVLHTTHTREMDHLGGLLKRMPITGTTFLIAAIAISGIPPLNGFVSEFLIYLGSLKGLNLETPTVVMLLCLIAGLALIGGLASACFTKAFGTVFLGEPRSEHASHAHEVNLSMRISQILLAAGCIFIGLFAVLIFPVMIHILTQVTGVPLDKVQKELAETGDVLSSITYVISGLVVFTLALAVIRKRLLRDRKVEETVTWDCGYLNPTTRMQYTSSSFAGPLVDVFRTLLRTRKKEPVCQALFPTNASFSSETPDISKVGLYKPVFDAIGRGLSGLRLLQHGRLHIYVLYIVVTLLILLVWGLR